MRKLSISKGMLIPGLIILAVIAAVIIALVIGSAEPKTKVNKLPAAAYKSACGVYRNDRTVTINGTSFKTEVNRTKDEFEKGLGGRPCILPNQAMLFSYTKPLQIGIWMKNMKFPIDVIWIGPDHKVAAEEIDLKPSTYPDKFVNKDRPAQYVLEIKANRANELNIGLGTPINF